MLGEVGEVDAPVLVIAAEDEAAALKGGSVDGPLGLDE